ncbi:proline iminopeptidase [Penicillium angulare]|uniref:proline iminopeptidase n=1 Tax=Penicillium angulare TaxID=116970 RepID=UPI002540BFBB|nr:proline iminopeptidase [Penicillium angulare]KAJ5266725.1 proline iminopeptidase [Penicillium angulare]
MIDRTSSRYAGYEPGSPYESACLDVDELHSLHYEQYGTPDGLPVVFLHGGPGGQISVNSARFFNPDVYRVVLFDQRGSGRSTPKNELRNNTSQHLVGDIEKLRIHLRIEKWHLIFGGSWGTTLGLLYTQTHPDRVKSLILRGVTTLRKTELAHSRRGLNGAARVFPDMYDRFVGFLPENERNDVIAGYYNRLTSGDSKIACAAAMEWNRWDLTLTALRRDTETYQKLDDPDWCFTHALLEAHYFHNNAFIEEGQLLANMDKMSDIPGAIVQGRYDLITPPKTAWELHKTWPHSTIHWIEDAGHAATEPGTFSRLVEICDDFAKL